MEEYLNRLTRNIVKKNEEYTFVGQEEIFIPFIRTTLSITKRAYFKLHVLDEMILRLNEEGIHETKQISNILGISKRLLDVAIADLHVKDMLSYSAGNCVLLSKGRQALKELHILQKQKDIMRNVYLDPIHDTILIESEKYDFLNRVYGTNKKLDADYDCNNIEIFRKNISSVNEIFVNETKEALNNTRRGARIQKSDIPNDELISIDAIDKAYVKFVGMPIYIYVSKHGLDIDILPVKRKQENIFYQFKDEIIHQIRKHVILTDFFTKYRKNNYKKVDIELNFELEKILYKYQKAQIDKEECITLIQPLILSQRKLFENEFDALVKYLIDQSEHIEILVHTLDEWCWNKKFTDMVSRIESKKLVQLSYQRTHNLEKCLRKLDNLIKDKLIQKEINENYLVLIFDQKVKILCVPKEYQVIDKNTYVYKMEYFIVK